MNIHKEEEVLGGFVNFGQKPNRLVGVIQFSSLIYVDSSSSDIYKSIYYLKENAVRLHDNDQLVNAV
jgi:hypothetical protein